MADLQADYPVVAIDLRGYNLSDKPVDPQAYEISQLVGDVRAVIEHEDAAYAVRHDQAMARSSLDAMFNYYRINWPTEPYAVRSDTPPMIQAPTLLIHGLDDPYALASGLNDVWRWVKRELTILTLPGEGHFIQHECAAKVTRAVRAWLAQQVQQEA